MTEERLPFPRTELRRRTARGVVVNAAFRGGSEAIVLAQGLIVTVLLGPAAIGLYGIVTTTAMSVVELRRAGIEEAFVQQSDARQELEFQRAFSLELIVGLAFSLLLAALAPLVALAYGDDELLLLMLAVAYLPIAFALQAPTWIFLRRMDFVRVRIVQAVLPVVSFVVTVPLAFAGVGVWSLVIGPFVGHVAAVAVGVGMSPYQIRLRFDRAAWTHYVRFSWPILVSAGALLFVQQGQVFLFDLDGGLVAAGYITLAVTLMRLAERADQIVAATIYPAICAVRDQTKTLEEVFVKSNRLTLMWVLPLCVGAILFAPDLVTFVLGEEWRPATILIQGLAGAAALQQLGFNWVSFYRARGNPRPQATESAVMVGSFLGLAVPGLLVLGPSGFVAGRVSSAALVLGVRRRFVRRLLPAVSLLRLGLRGAAPVAAGALAALLVRAAPWQGGRSLAAAILELVVFLGVTALVTWRAERPLLREVLGHVRSGGGPVASIASAPEPVAPTSVEPASLPQIR